MKGLFKLFGGLVLGAAVGAGLYVLLTRKEESDLMGEVKGLVQEVIAEGKRAAQERRVELEAELGHRANGSQA